MLALKRWLQKYRVRPGSPANLASLKGGLWYILPKERGTFFEKYAAAVKASKGNDYLCFVFRPPTKNVKLQPLMFDIDIKTLKKIPVDTEAFVKLAQALAKDIAAQQTGKVEFCVVTKREGYFKQRKKEGDSIFCTGAHFYFPKTVVDVQFAERIRQAAIAHVPDIFGHLHFVNTPDDVMDKRIPTLRANGLMMIGSFKPQKIGVGMYCVKYVGTLQGGNFTGKHMSEPQFLDCFGDSLEELYGHAFREDRKKVSVLAAPTEHVHKVKPRLDRETRGEVVWRPEMMAPAYGFNLNEFIKATSGWQPNNEQYVAFCMYLASIGYNAVRAQTLLNRAWNPPADKLNETSQLIRRYTGRSISVTRGTPQHLLTNHASKEYDVSVVFPPKYKYHNECIIFDDNKRIWYDRELIDFFNNVYNFQWGGGKTSFTYQEIKTVHSGTDYYQVTRSVITDNPPFSEGKCDKQVKMHACLRKLQNIVKQISSTKAKKYLEEDELIIFLKRKNDAQEIMKNNFQNYKILYDFLNAQKLLPQPQYNFLSALFLKYKQRGFLKNRYHSFTLEPYLAKDLTPDDQYNLFTGFDLHTFRNTKIDVKKTKIWEWLWVCWANREERKMSFLLNCLAHKLQFPHRKLCKFLIAFGTTGIGKTTMRFFLEKIYDKDKVLFVYSIDDYLKEQNADQLGKLWVVCDDIEKCRHKTANLLKGRITGTTIRYRKLYCDPITMPSYCDLVCTSNARNPVFVDHSDRRSELIVINPEKKGEKTFWDAFYNELDDLIVCGAWFEFLATYKIDMNVSSENVRFDPAVLSLHKMDSVKLSHRFCIEFFENERCFEDACRNPKVETAWFDGLEFFRIDGMEAVFISKTKTYEYFCHWKQQNGFRNDLKKTTFVADLCEIGLVANRRRLKKCRPFGFTFCRPLLKKSIASFYLVKTSDFSMNYCFENNSEQPDTFGRYQECVWLFRNVDFQNI